MSRSRLYEASIENIDLESEIERLRNQANLSPQKEARALTQFGLRPDMSVLEVASGPGFVTQWLSSLVTDGSITCVEIDPILIQRAEQHLKDHASCPYRIVQGSVMSMEFPDNTFDFAFVRLLLEHLEDPVGAIKEIMRVLKPGCKLVVAEGDFAFNNITHPFVEAVQPIREKARQMQESQGGRPRIGSALWSILRSAGFQKIDLEAIVSHSGDKGVKWFYPQFNPARLSPLVEAGIISSKEQEDFREALDEFMASDESFYMRIILMACGEKP